MLKRFFSTIVAVFAVVFSASAQAPDPELEFVVELKVKLGQAYGVGETAHGNRFIIPITGGTFEGPNIKGEVLPGGADYQMSGKTHTDIEAIYCIRTDDGVTIHIRNKGIIAGSYFYCSPKFEAPVDSKYAWLNDAIFVCRPSGTMVPGGIGLKVWKVRDKFNFESTIQPILPIPDEVRKPNAKQGRIEEFKYMAHKNGRAFQKHARVYTPFGYKAKDKTTNHHILYLMHGGRDNTTSFLTPP